MNLNTTGERIRWLREKKGITQADLASAVLVSRDVITSWESNRREIKASLLVALADYFDVSTDFLLMRTDVLPIRPDILKMESATGLTGLSLHVLQIEAGQDNNEEPSEDSEAFLEIINAIIPSLPYSSACREYRILRDIYKNGIYKYGMDSRGPSIEHENGNPVVRLDGEEVIRFVLSDITHQLGEYLVDDLKRRYTREPEFAEGDIK